ncbi:MAG: hypothetical protein ACE5GM_05165 [bacterium]
MKKWIIGCLIVLIAGCTSQESKEMTKAKTSFTPQQVTAGKAMFSDDKLGTLGRTCNGCHEDMDSIKSFVNKRNTDVEKLQHKINICFTSAMEGPELAPDNATLGNLTAYLLTLKK